MIFNKFKLFSVCVSIVSKISCAKQNHLTITANHNTNQSDSVKTQFQNSYDFCVTFNGFYFLFYKCIYLVLKKKLRLKRKFNNI